MEKKKKDNGERTEVDNTRILFVYKYIIKRKKEKLK